MQGIVFAVLFVALVALLSSPKWWDRVRIPSDGELGVVIAAVGIFIAFVAIEDWVWKGAGMSLIFGLAVVQFRQVHKREWRADLDRRAGFRRRGYAFYNKGEAILQGVHFRSVMAEIELRTADKTDVRKIETLKAKVADLEKEKAEALTRFKLECGTAIVLLIREMEDQYGIDGYEFLALFEPHPWDITFEAALKIKNTLPDFLECLDRPTPRRSV